MTQDDIDQFIEELSDEQRLLASIRTIQKMGIDFQLEADKLLVEDGALDGREQEFGEAFVLEVLSIHANRIRDLMVDEGLGEKVLREDGEVVLKVNDEGKRLMRELGMDVE